MCTCVYFKQVRERNIQETGKSGCFWGKKLGSVEPKEGRLSFNPIFFHSFWIFYCMNVLPLQKKKVTLKSAQRWEKAFIDGKM